MKRALIPAALTAAFSVAAGAPEDAVKKEMGRLQGKWTVVSMERDGDSLRISGDRCRVITDNKYTLSVHIGVTVEGTFKLDPTANPKTIETTQSAGPFKGQEMLGIYELDGDTLKLCYAPPGKERPAEFATKPGSGWILSVQKRAKE